MYLALPATQARFTLAATKLKKPPPLRFHSLATSAQKYYQTFALIYYWCSHTHGFIPLRCLSEVTSTKDI